MLVQRKNNDLGRYNSPQSRNSSFIEAPESLLAPNLFYTVQWILILICLQSLHIRLNIINWIIR
jgi:hypothetical protein